MRSRPSLRDEGEPVRAHAEGVVLAHRVRPGWARAIAERGGAGLRFQLHFSIGQAF